MQKRETCNQASELHVRALFEEACASQGLTGKKIVQAAEVFIEAAHELGIKIMAPDGLHLVLGKQ